MVAVEQGTLVVVAVVAQVVWVGKVVVVERVVLVVGVEVAVGLDDEFVGVVEPVGRVA